mgnify:CR=1 FL=1
MKMNKYFEQAKLMLSILPIDGQEKEFALKGGTALNFFYLNLPRLSVDIDLTFLPVKPRDETLRDITNSLSRISDKVKRLFPLCQIQKLKIKEKQDKIVHQIHFWHLRKDRNHIHKQKVFLYQVF